MGALVPGAGNLPPEASVSQLVMLWHNQVVFAPDPARGGIMAPGLAGRLYLYSKDSPYPLSGDGSLIVDLYDLAKKTPEGQPTMLEQWRIDKDALRRQLSHDTIGWGYTLLLPWGTYRPDLAHIGLRVRYDPAKGLPIFADPATLTFHAVQEFKMTSSSQTLGGPPKAAPAAAAAAGRPGERVTPATIPNRVEPGVAKPLRMGEKGR
jgi:hypothetical protein